MHQQKNGEIHLNHTQNNLNHTVIQLKHTVIQLKHTGIHLKHRNDLHVKTENIRKHRVSH